MGGGTAVLFPLAVSAAAQFSDKTAAANVASLAQISFIVFNRPTFFRIYS